MAIKIDGVLIAGKGKDGKGVPTGGLAGQILSKKSSTDYDTEWIDAPTGGGTTEGITAEQVDQKISTAIDRLVDGAPGTMDTLKEVSDAIAEHKEVTDALNSAIGNKVDKTTTINGKALSSNISLSAADVGAITSAQVDDKISTAIEGAGAVTPEQVDQKISAALAGKVDKTTTVNNKALSSNITLSASDVGTYTSTKISQIIATAKEESQTYVDNAIKTAIEDTWSASY